MPEPEVRKIGPLGPYDNNAYLVIDPGSRSAIIVDAPLGGERILEEADGLQVEGIVMTHRHGDHWGTLDLLKERTGAPVFCHADDAAAHADKVDLPLAHGDDFKLGSVHIEVIHTPGHTPGSVCLLAGDVLISGDALFPGGPGHTDTPDDLRRAIASITDRLLVLPDATIVHPGHGDSTTVGDARREYEAFAARPHPPDLCGDVTWDGN